MPLDTLLVIDLQSVGFDIRDRLEDLLHQDLSLALNGTLLFDWPKIAEQLLDYPRPIVWIHLDHDHKTGLDLIKRCHEIVWQVQPPSAHVIASSFAPKAELVTSAFEQGAVDFCDLARFGAWTIQEKINPGNVPSYKPGSSHGFGSGIKIFTPKQDIYI